MKYFIRFASLLVLFVIGIQIAGCGSAELSSAKLYRQKRDYISADARLKQAIKDDPTSDEAWTLYVENLYDLKEYEKIAEVIDTARLYAITHRPEIDQYRQNAWIQLYNGGLNAFTQNPDSKEQQQAAIGYLQAARKLNADQPETYLLLGEIYSQQGDTTEAINTFNQALNQVGPSIDQGTSLGLLLHMTTQQVQQAIGGAPARMQTVPTGVSDSTLIYIYPSKEAFLYFERATRAPHDWQLTGWRFTPDEQSGILPLHIDTTVYERVANYYYNQGRAAVTKGDKAGAQRAFDKAMPLLQSLQQFYPEDETASLLIPDMYNLLGKPEKARERYEKDLRDHPTVQKYVSYGNLLLKTNDYSNAIANYEKALTVDPNYEPALYNLAATYKNWAAADQKAGNNKDLKPRIQKSTDYFERMLAVNKTDFNILAQLQENYDILGQKDKAATILGDLESLKTSAAAQNPDYWHLLGKLYARTNRGKDAEAAFDKEQQLRK